MSVGQYCIGQHCGNIAWPLFSITVSVVVLQHVYIYINMYYTGSGSYSDIDNYIK